MSEPPLDPALRLAGDRTVLAAERTYAAWMRTGIASLASGVGARALLAHAVPGWLATTAAVTLATFSAFCFVAAVWRELHPGVERTASGTARLPAALLVAVNGVLVLVAVAALVGIVTAR